MPMKSEGVTITHSLESPNKVPSHSLKTTLGPASGMGLWLGLTTWRILNWCAIKRGQSYYGIGSKRCARLNTFLITFEVWALEVYIQAILSQPGDFRRPQVGRPKRGTDPHNCDRCRVLGHAQQNSRGRRPPQVGAEEWTPVHCFQVHPAPDRRWALSAGWHQATPR